MTHHGWDEDHAYVSTGSFGVEGFPRDMEVCTPTDDVNHVVLCGMICSFAITALENGIPLGALHIKGRRPFPEEDQ